MRGAHPERALEEAIERDGVVRRGERILIACSAGPDSIALTGALHAVAKPMDLQLCIAHVNHGARASAWQDECVVLRIGSDLGLPTDIVALEPGTHDEQRLRRARYRALVDRARNRSCTAIATAHHAEDQSESVLLALLRGAGPQGLSGMRARRALRDGVELARPLLMLPSASLVAYCHARALPYAVDPTNADLGLRRNAIRDALGTLRGLFPQLDSAVARAAELVAAERDATQRADLRNAVRERLAVEEDLRDIDFAHVEAVVRAIEGGRSGAFYMKPGVSLRIERGSITGVAKT